jgi:hypothetical protein
MNHYSLLLLLLKLGFVYISSSHFVLVIFLFAQSVCGACAQQVMAIPTQRYFQLIDEM